MANETKAKNLIAAVDGWCAAKTRVDAAFAKVDGYTSRGPFARAPKSAMLEMERAVRNLSRWTAKWQAAGAALA